MGSACTMQTSLLMLRESRARYKLPRRPHTLSASHAVCSPYESLCPALLSLTATSWSVWYLATHVPLQQIHSLGAGLSHCPGVGWKAALNIQTLVQTWPYNLHTAICCCTVYLAGQSRSQAKAVLPENWQALLSSASDCKPTSGQVEPFCLHLDACSWLCYLNCFAK